MVGRKFKKMSLFGKKKLYKIIWSWGNPYIDSYTEIIAAKDPAHAGKKFADSMFFLLI